VVERDRADAHEQRVRPELGRRQLREVAEHAVHPRPDLTAEEDEIDPGSIDEDVRDIERIRDHRHPAVDEAARQLECGAPTADRDRGAVRNEVRRHRPDRGLRRDCPDIAHRAAVGERRAAVRPEQAALVREPLEVAADRGRRDSEAACEIRNGGAPTRLEIGQKAIAPVGRGHGHGRRIGRPARVVND